MNEEPASPQPLTKEEQIARKAARLVKASKPRLKRAIELTRPRAEAAGREDNEAKFFHDDAFS